MGKGMWAVKVLAIAQVASAPDGSGLGLQIKPEMLTEHFLASHPDLRWQREGMHSLERGRHATAMTQLKRAGLRLDGCRRRAALPRPGRLPRAVLGAARAA